jgi:hypothetical protein
MNGNAPTLEQILAAQHGAQPGGWGQPLGGYLATPQMFPAAPARSRSRLLGFAVGGLVLAAGLWLLGHRDEDTAQSTTLPSPAGHATLLDATVPTPYIAIGGHCPKVVDTQAGGETRLVHRYLSTNKHLLICSTADGQSWAYLEDRSNPADQLVLRAKKATGGYQAETTGTKVSVSWDSGLTLTGTRPLREPVVLERSGTPGHETEKAR